MRQKLLYIPMLIALLFLTGCERTGYYSDGEQQIIDDLTEKNWTRSYKFDVEGEVHSGQETYTFKKDGNCTIKIKEIDSSGKVSERSRNSLWAFYTPDFYVLYFNSGVYWEIKNLTSSKLSVTEILGEYGSLTSLRDSKEFTIGK